MDNDYLFSIAKPSSGQGFTKRYFKKFTSIFLEIQ